jgi:hypothetical protein
MGERRYLAIRFLDRLTISSTNLFAYRAEDLLPDSSCNYYSRVLKQGIKSEKDFVWMTSNVPEKLLSAWTPTSQSNQSCSDTNLDLN